MKTESVAVWEHQSVGNVQCSIRGYAEPEPVGCVLTTGALKSSYQPMMSLSRRWLNIFGLSMGWCLMVSMMFIQLSTTTLAARDFAGSSTATLPAGVMMAAAALSMTPGSLLMERFGRKAVLLASALGGTGGGVMLVLAARYCHLGLLIVGSVPLGVCFALANNLRFAATEFAPPGLELQAMSLVVTGAVLSSVVGPEVGRHTLHAMEPPYTATYCFLTALVLLYAVLVAAVDFSALPDLAVEKAVHASAGGGTGSGAAGGGGVPMVSPGGQAASVAGCGRRVDAAAASPSRVICGCWAAHASQQSPPPPKAVESPSSSAAGPLKKESASDSFSWCEVCRPGQLTGLEHDSSTSGGEPGGAAVAKSGQHGDGGGSSELPVPGQRSDMLIASCSPEVMAEVAVKVGEEERECSSGSCTSSSCSHPSGMRGLLLSWEYVVTVVTAALSYNGMAGMMTASPLAIRDMRYSFSQTTQVIQVHIISMFLPSLCTGHVISLLGAAWTMTLGAVTLLGGTAVFFAGNSLPVFFAGNSVVGLGWNWAYVGASALVADRYQPSTKFVAQGVMDTAVLAGTGLAVVLAGSLYSRLGWEAYVGVFMGVSGFIVVMDGALLVRRGMWERRTRKDAGAGAAAGGKLT